MRDTGAASDMCAVQDLLQQSMPVAQTALLQFTSCVRTTLLLSHGYECQEKVTLCAHPQPGVA